MIRAAGGFSWRFAFYDIPFGRLLPFSGLLQEEMISLQVVGLEQGLPCTCKVPRGGGMVESVDER